MSRQNHSLTYSYLMEKYGLVISFRDAANELDVYWENLRRLCQRGEIKVQKVGRAWMLTTKALADYIDYGLAGGSKGSNNVLNMEKSTGRKCKSIKYVSL